LELLWRAERRDVRRLYQGILQIGVAFHHLRRRKTEHGRIRYEGSFLPGVPAFGGV